jgi:acetyl esterase
MEVSVKIDPLDFIDTEYRPFVEYSTPSDRTLEGLGFARNLLKTLESRCLRQLRRHVHIIPGLDGGPDVRMLVFDPSPAASSRPAVLLIHGGGMII